MIAAFSMSAQEFKGLDKSPLDMIQFPHNRETKKSIRVLYSPQLKGRPLAKLAPNGKVWRTGANEASEITFNTAMNQGIQPFLLEVTLCTLFQGRSRGPLS